MCGRCASAPSAPGRRAARRSPPGKALAPPPSRTNAATVTVCSSFPGDAGTLRPSFRTVNLRLEVGLARILRPVSRDSRARRGRRIRHGPHDFTTGPRRRATDRGADLTIEGFHVVHEFMPRFRDTDAMGHINNAVYIIYLEVARQEYWRALDGTQDYRRVPFILAHVTVTSSPRRWSTRRCSSAAAARHRQRRERDDAAGHRRQARARGVPGALERARRDRARDRRKSTSACGPVMVRAEPSGSAPSYRRAPTAGCRAPQPPTPSSSRTPVRHGRSHDAGPE